MKLCSVSEYDCTENKIEEETACVCWWISNTRTRWTHGH